MITLHIRRQSANILKEYFAITTNKSQQQSLYINLFCHIAMRGGSFPASSLYILRMYSLVGGIRKKPTRPHAKLISVISRM